MTGCVRWMAAVLVGVVMAAGATAQQGTSLAFRRADHLRRGINLSMWYAQSDDYSAARLAQFTTPADFQLIKGLGFDHVRLSINPEPLTQEPQMGALRVDAMARLDETIRQLTAAGLNVVLDIHPEDSWKDKQLKGGGVDQFLAFWTVFAGHYAGTDPEKVFFELMNEPMMDNYRWQAIEARAVARVRSVAPQHTIIATSSNYSPIDTLLAMEPVRDENVIYTFHEYNPFWFTHQGASWGTPAWVYLRGVPYPSTPENVNRVLGQEPDARARLELQRYGYDRWDAVRLGMEIAAMAEWGQRRGVPLYCGEFGVYRAFADAKSRTTWISDVRTALESKRIGWSMWDYQGSFGLVTKGSGGTVVDAGVAAALGLKR